MALAFLCASNSDVDLEFWLTFRSTRRTPPANVSMPPANVSTKGSPVTASSAMPSELVAQDARVLVVIQGVGCQPEPSSMPYTGQVMMILGGGLAAAASANSAEP